MGKKTDFSKQQILHVPSGARIAFRHLAAANDARAIVHINHGLSEHSGRYERFASMLAENDIHVFAHDHRGHGHTCADNAPLGMFCKDGMGVHHVIADIKSMHDHINMLYSNLPMFMFGHSMGGLIAMNYALKYPKNLNGVAIWNSNFSAGLAGRLAQALLAFEKMRLGSDVPSQIMPKLTFKTWAKKIHNKQTDFDWLSTQSDEVKKYIEDPLCGWNASISLWQDIFSLIYSGSNIQGLNDIHLKIAFQIVGGGQDPATNNARATIEHARRLTKAGFVNVTTHIYKNARHETLNEYAADDAMKHFIDWLNKTINMR